MGSDLYENQVVDLKVRLTLQHIDIKHYIIQLLLPDVMKAKNNQMLFVQNCLQEANFTNNWNFVKKRINTINNLTLIFISCYHMQIIKIQSNYSEHVL